MPTAKSNPALEGLAPIVGDWSTVGHHPMLPGKTLRGHASFEWFEDGAFLVMRTSMDEPAIPAGIAIIGSDDRKGTFTMLYFDERGVSRNYDVSIDATGFSWSRMSADFSQRFTVRFANDGQTMHGTGEMSRDGGAWEPDLQLDYSRETNRSSANTGDISPASDRP